MYVRVLQDELQFPEDKAMDQDTKSLIRGVCAFLLLTSFERISNSGRTSYSNETLLSGCVNLGSRSILTFP